MTFAEVAVDAPVEHSRTFSYSVPLSLPVRPGHLVRVPFGARVLQGVVFSLEEVPQVPHTRDIAALEFPEPLLDDLRLRLARWLSEYYLCSLFEAASLFLPAGGHVRPKTYLSLVSEPPEDVTLSPAQERVVAYLARRRGRPVDMERLVKALGEGVRASVSRLVSMGLVERETRAARPAHHRVVELAALPQDRMEEARREAEAMEGRAPRQAALLHRLLDLGAPMPLTQARKEFGAGAVAALLRKRLLRRQRVTVDRDPLAGHTFAPRPPVRLTASQRGAAEAVAQALKDHERVPRSFLLYGVTGSGKTEVYLAAVERCLEEGKRAIVLVPEIALTHQTIERFAARFPGQVAVLHSGLSDGERFDQWWKIKGGEYGLVVGSRSAIFAPQPDLGLVVIDEEHEWTYKQQDATPRYHARDVALRLSSMTGAVVLMGSASPDVVTYHQAVRGVHRLLRLPFRVVASSSDGAPRVSRAPLASVRVVDMRRELREGNAGIFSRALSSAMEEALSAGEQVVLFLNRRGSAAYMQCRHCGYTLRCRRCDIALSYHRDIARLLCHYCGYRRIAPARCPRCTSYRMSLYGIGTEAVVQEVERLFPGASVMRWDRDTTREPRAYEAFLERFRSGEAQVLVGTQMIAKGLHFPHVTLVGVVLADVGLGVPDFRAGERAFQLLCQVAGRAGRGPLGGQVIVQTYQPDNYAIRAAARQDYRRFYAREIGYRREQGNPPFSRLARLLYVHTNAAAAEREASRVAQALAQEAAASGHSELEVLGPTPAYPPRLRGRYRWQVVLRGPDPRSLLEGFPLPHGWTVDVDPAILA